MDAATRTACVLTIGNEIVSGDVENTNASWIARRLAQLGVDVGMLAALKDEVETVAMFLADRHRFDYVFVTGGLGRSGSPDGSPSLNGGFANANAASRATRERRRYYR